MNVGYWKADSILSGLPKCDTTGRLQEMTSEICKCDLEKMKPDWLCSKFYMCSYTRQGTKHLTLELATSSPERIMRIRGDDNDD